MFLSLSLSVSLFSLSLYLFTSSFSPALTFLMIFLSSLHNAIFPFFFLSRCLNLSPTLYLASFFSSNPSLYPDNHVILSAYQGHTPVTWHYLPWHQCLDGTYILTAWIKYSQIPGLPLIHRSACKLLPLLVYDLISKLTLRKGLKRGAALGIKCALSTIF